LGKLYVMKKSILIAEDDETTLTWSSTKPAPGLKP
jgi:hypothetical protein